MTALHLAAKAGNVEACHYLISNPSTPRSFIDSVDDGRWTPLVWAAEHKHYEVIKSVTTFTCTYYMICSSNTMN